VASSIRKALSVGAEPEAQPGVVFQFNIPRSVMEANASLKELLDNPAFNMWLGAGRYCITFPTHDGCDAFFDDEEYGTLHETAPWKKLTDMEYLRRRFQGSAPVLDEILAKAEDCYKWRTPFMLTLSSWRSDNGRVVLIGDAAHAMGPYASQVSYFPSIRLCICARDVGINCGIRALDKASKTRRYWRNS
jgi:salicylate hydroxylase